MTWKQWNFDYNVDETTLHNNEAQLIAIFAI